MPVVYAFILKVYSMKKNLSFINSNTAGTAGRSRRFNVFVLLIVFLFVCAQAGAAGITRTWVGTGVGAGANLVNGSNWNPAGVPTASDTCVISYSGVTGGSFNLNLPTTSSLSISMLTIRLSAPVTATATTLITFNILNTLSISGALTITNTSASPFNDEIDFNIGNSSGTTPGTINCGSIATSADGMGNSSNAFPTLHFVINAGSTVTCNGNWSSTSAAGSYTSTLVQNNGTLTINGNTSLNNLGKSGKNTINFLIGNSPSISTFGGNAIFGSPVFKQWDSIRSVSPHDTINFKDTVLIGGISNASTGTFAFKGTNDTLGYNMGITNFRKGTLLFNNATASTQTMVSYASDDAPDRTPGIFQVGSTNSPIVNYQLGAGDNDALTISSAFIVNTNSSLALSGVVTPYNLSKIDTNGLVQVKAGAKLILLTAAGKTSSVPGNYKIYNFDPTSTLVFNGKGYQTLYSGVDYGNVIISGNKDSVKTAGGTLTIKGTLTIDTGRIFQVRFDTSLVKDTITIQGGITNYGTFNAMDGTVILDSNTNVFISGTSVTTFNKLIIDKFGVSVTGSVTMNKNVIVTDSASIRSGILALNGNTLTLNGTTVGNSLATISGSKTSGLIIGGNADNLYFTQSGTNNYLKTFTISGNATLKNALNIAAGDSTSGYGTLTVNGSLHTGNLLTLKSDVNGTALVGPSTGVINDTVTVERYFPALRAWRFVAVPFSSSNQTINSAWQEGLVNSVLQCPSQFTGTPGYGTEISGGTPANGYDVNNTGYPSIKVYQNNAWIVPLSTYSNLITTSTNNAYTLFVRGDRSVCLTNVYPADVTVLRPRGILNQQGSSTYTVNFSGAHAGDFIFIGNPYAAPLDIRPAVKLNNSGIEVDKFWVWDPTLGGALGVGGYVAFSNGVQVPYNLIDTTNYAANTVIQSGESFMVQVNSSNSTGMGSVTFKENDKSSVERTTGVFGWLASPKQSSQSSFTQPSPKQRNPHTPPALYVNMLDQNNVIMDGVGVAFGNKYSPYIDSIDAQKKWNEEIENMAIVKHDTTLAIDFRPVAKASDTVFIRVYLRQHPYTLQVFTRGVRKDLPAEGWLVDKYLGTQTQLDIYHVNLYTFTPNSDTNSYRNRFMLVFNRTGKKQQQDKGIKTSTNTVAGSSLVNGGSVSIYPNPVTAGTAMLRFNNMPAGSYELIVYNAVGEQLSNINLEHNGVNTVYPLQISGSWGSGLFAINVLNKNTGKMIVVKTLVSK